MDIFEAFMFFVVEKCDVFPKVRVRVGSFDIADVEFIAEEDVTNEDVNTLVADLDDSMRDAVTCAVVSSVEVINDVSVNEGVMVGGVDFIDVNFDCTLMVDVTGGGVDIVVTIDSGSVIFSVTSFD